MGRHQTIVSHEDARRSRLEWRPEDPESFGGWRIHPYWNDWGRIVGARIRAQRAQKGWTLLELASRIEKPEGGQYSTGFYSRLERGWTSAPFYVFIHLARVLDMSPSALLGPDDVTAEQDALLRFLKLIDMDPAEAMAIIAARGQP